MTLYKQKHLAAVEAIWHLSLTEFLLYNAKQFILQMTVLGILLPAASGITGPPARGQEHK